VLDLWSLLVTAGCCGVALGGDSPEQSKDSLSGNVETSPGQAHTFPVGDGMAANDGIGRDQR
jgi:hypothetical protein